MLKSKKNKSAQPDDFSALDSAVSELSQQTEALLQSFKEEPRALKPTLPKKNAAAVVPKSVVQRSGKGKSFDIIQHPAQKKRLNATLKTATASKPLLLLPEAPQEDAPKTSVAQVVHTHKEGALHGFSTVQQTDAVASVDVEPEQKKPESKAEETMALKPKDNKEDAKSPLSFTEEKTVDVVSETETDNKNDLKAQVADTVEDSQNDASQPVLEESSKEVEETAYRGELYANNLVKETTPKGLELSEDDKHKPMIFDTEEYHPELHDWSKLEPKSKSPLIVLLILIIVAAGLAYFILSGHKLRFR